MDYKILIDIHNVDSMFQQADIASVYMLLQVRLSSFTLHLKVTALAGLVRPRKGKDRELEEGVASGRMLIPSHTVFTNALEAVIQEPARFGLG